MISLAEQIAEAQRELALRRQCYPQWVKSGKLDAGAAKYQILAMQEIVRTLLQIDAEQRQLSLCGAGGSRPRRRALLAANVSHFQISHPTKGILMLSLPTEFEDRLFRYAQVEREGDMAIFTQEHKASGIVRYEVVVIRVQKEHTWPTGVTTPEKEAYPGSTSWGRLGHTCFTLPEAQALAATWRQQRAAAPLPEEADEDLDQEEGTAEDA